MADSGDVLKSFEARLKRQGLLPDGNGKAAVDISSLSLSAKEQQMMRDPRIRYEENKEEKHFHPSAIADKCDELNSADEERVIFFNDHDALLRLEQNRCRHDVCNWECIETCPYYAEQGVETPDGEIFHKGEAGYNAVLEQWQEFLLSHRNSTFLS